jgi:hypothetical protein
VRSIRLRLSRSFASNLGVESLEGLRQLLPRSLKNDLCSRKFKKISTRRNFSGRARQDLLELGLAPFEELDALMALNGDFESKDHYSIFGLTQG